MNKINIKKSKGGITYKFENFESIGEVINANKKREVTEAWKGQSECLNDEKIARKNSFYGCSSMDEAYQLIKDGWCDGTKSLLKKVEKIGRSQNRVKVLFENHQMGFAPNIARAVQNMPNCMIRAKRVPIKSKIVTIIYDTSCSWTTSLDELLQSGLNVLELVIGLEAIGYRVNLKVGMGVFNHKSEVNALFCDVKRASEPLNLKKIAFPIAHPSWFRLVSFDWQERSPITSYIPARGCAYYSAVGGRIPNGDMESVLDKNSYYITHDDAYKGVENLVEKIKGLK